MKKTILSLSTLFIIVILQSCTDAQAVSGKYDGQFVETGNVEYQGYFYISVVHNSFINIEPGGFAGAMNKIYDISVIKTGNNYTLKAAYDSNMDFFDGQVTDNNISCTYAFNGDTTVYQFNGSR